MFLVWGIFCGRHLCAGAARQQPSRTWGEAICEGGGHPPTCSSWKFFCTLLGSNLLELLVMFAFLNWDLKPLAIMILGIRMINMAMIWQSPFDTAMLITGLGCLFGTVPSKLRISAWDWRQHLRAFRHAGGELRSVRAIEIRLNHLILTQKHKSWAFWPSGCRRGFAIQGSWRGQKPRKKKPKTENRVEVWSQRTLSNAKTAISPVRTTWCWFLRTDDFLDCFWSAPRCCACPAKRPCPRPERRRPWSTWSGKTNVWNFLKVLCMPKMLLKNDRFLLQVLLLLWLYSLLSSILLSLILV